MNGYDYEIFLILIIIFVPLLSQLSINSNYKKYSKIKNNRNITGYEVAKKILYANDIAHVKVNKTYGFLSDHYNPRTKQINLSEDIYESTSIAAIAVAAHECGHAIQDKVSYTMLRVRSSLVPIVNISSKLSYILVLMGFLASSLNLINLGIIFMVGVLVFQLVTLPVEFNASSRAMKELEKLGLVSSSDKKGVRKVLKAAALTYVASVIATIAQMARLLLLNRNRR